MSGLLSFWLCGSGQWKDLAGGANPQKKGAKKKTSRLISTASFKATCRKLLLRSTQFAPAQSDRPHPNSSPWLNLQNSAPSPPSPTRPPPPSSLLWRCVVAPVVGSLYLLACHIVSRTRPIAWTDDTQAVKCATPAFRNTKIVGTMGPSCWDVETLGSEWMTPACIPSISMRHTCTSAAPLVLLRCACFAA